MSAIAAITRKGSAPATGECARMVRALRVYGPDGAADVNAGSAQLGVARANKLPEDRFDRQPLTLCDGRFVLVADCRIDNRADLLSACGKPALSEVSDAAVIGFAFEKWGENCFARLRGDFAVCVWDNAQQRFILARDIIGAAPLYFHHSDRMMAVASMPMGLHALEDVPRGPDTDYLKATLYNFGMAAEGSFWQAITRVKPAHIAIVSWQGVETRRYWSPPTERLRGGDHAEYAAELRRLILQATERRLRGSTHIGTHLSAGLDSGAITGAAAELLTGRGRITAFTSAPREGYDVPGAPDIIDESPRAAATAALHDNIDHVILRSRAEWSTDAIERMYQYSQQPSANICNLSWIAAIADAAKARGIKVLMPGQMGNLAMSYDGLHSLTEPLSRFDLGGVLRNMWQTRSSFLTLARHTAAYYGGALMDAIRPSGALKSYHVGHKDSEPPVQRPAWDYAGVMMETLDRVDLGPAHKALYAGWGIDQRDPTYDRDFFDFAASVPMSMFRYQGLERSMMRTAAKGWVAPEILESTLRGLQAADWHEGVSAHRGWVKEQMAAMRDHPEAAALIDVERLERIAAEEPEDWHEPMTTINHRLVLLRGISIGHFVRRASGSNR